ncbi:MATE efflux family protein [Actinidia rufa]|uniref:MATE efflux family protein n=1 Tax=Actinidia rufa TaxID=165716 RepID=A0A7J0HER5_9ERIC|nr:MATE efflux family protein [Actinidia rufa]
MKYSSFCAKTRVPISLESQYDLNIVYDTGIPLGFGAAVSAAVSTRGSNELGAGNPQGARLAVVFCVMPHGHRGYDNEHNPLRHSTRVCCVMSKS